MWKKGIAVLLFTAAVVNVYGEKNVDEFTNAKLYYEEKNFEKSCQILNKISTKNEEELLLEGECLEKLSRYKEALTAYESILKINPKNIKARLSIIKIYHDTPLKNRKNEEREIAELNKENKSEEIKKYIDSLKQENEKEMSEYTYDLSLIYNDNINNGTLLEKISEGDKEFLISEDQKAKHDFSIKLNTMAGYKVIETKNLLVEPIGVINYEKFLKYKELDIFDGAFNLFTMIKEKGRALSFPIEAGTLFTGYKQEEVRLKGGINFDITLNKNLILLPHTGVMISKNFKEEYTGRSYSAGGGIKGNLFSNIIYIDITGEKNNLSKEYLSNGRAVLTFEGARDLSENFSASLKGSIEYKGYDKEEIQFNKKRNEVLTTAGGEITFRNIIADITAAYEYRKKSSTLTLYEYTGNLFKIGIKKEY